MVTARRPRAKPPKKDRVRAHIEELKRMISGKYPEAAFAVGPVPDIRWPGLYVYDSLSEDAEDELHDLISEAQEQFFIQEWMTVFVFVRDPDKFGVFY